MLNGYHLYIYTYIYFIIDQFFAKEKILSHIMY